MITVTAVTDVTIRGLDDKVYGEFSAEARRQNKSIGDLATEAMRDYLRRLSLPQSGHIVSRIDALRVARRDLEEVGTPVSFDNIGLLAFEDDVDYDAFEKFVAGISACSIVELPKHIPKLKAIMRCKGCAQVRYRK